MDKKILVVFFSRTGNTRKVAEGLQEELVCDIEDIVDNSNRSGFFGLMKCGWEGIKKRTIKIEPLKYSPENYDLVVIATPIWASAVSTGIRTYVIENKDKFKEVAFLTTSAGAEDEKTFSELQGLCGKSPVSKCSISSGEIKSGLWEGKINKFKEQLI